VTSRTLVIDKDYYRISPLIFYFPILEII
jgi:hypothetical protein